MAKEKVRIANPLYDVVFRYLMQDNKVAKLVLSAIIGEEIEELVFNPTEYSSKIGDSNLTVIRMDFNAKIKTKDGGHRLVLIELQKAKHYFQIMRFRKYLGKQYINPENVFLLEKENNRVEEIPLPIFPIYILGEAFTKEKIPVIKVLRDYIDAATQKKIETKHVFVEALTHDAVVIQIPHLKEKRRTVLEQFLDIFDQSNKADMSGHMLEIVEEDYPTKYQEVIRRLKKAIASSKLLEEMEIEDDVLEEFHKMEKEAELAKAAKEEALKEKRQALKDKRKAEEEKEKAEQEKEKAEQQNEKLIQKLNSLGLSLADIAATAGISEEAVIEILKNTKEK